MRTMREQRLGDLPLKRLQLTANFRSQASWSTAFNNDFPLHLPRNRHAADPYELPYISGRRRDASNAYSDARVHGLACASSRCHVRTRPARPRQRCITAPHQADAAPQDPRHREAVDRAPAARGPHPAVEHRRPRSQTAVTSPTSSPR